MQAMPKGRLQNYSLQEEQISKDLALELRQLEVFRRFGGKKELIIDSEGNEQEKMLRIGRTQRPGSLPKNVEIGAETWRREKKNILLFLGWYINIKSQDAKGLTLLLMLDINLLAEYNFWSIDTRENTHSQSIHVSKAALGVAKWLNFTSSQRRDWSDIDEIVNIRNLMADFQDNYKQEKKVTDPQKWQHKEMTHAEARQIVEQLRAYCAPLSAKYQFDPKAHIHEPWYTRSRAVVWRYWQTFLIIKFLVYCPVRQGEIRTFKLNETLFRRTSESGKPYYVVLTQNHKNYSLTKKKRHYRIPDILTKDIDYWIYECMPEARKAVECLESWMEFWGHKPGSLEQKIEALNIAKEKGVKGIKARSKTSFDDYIKNLEMDIKGLELRIKGWEPSKANIESLEYLFCKTGKRHPHTFGVPLGINNVWAIVTEAVSRATLDLFGEERSLRTNPHAFRHIAEKQVRAAGNDAAAFGTYIGHSEAMGKIYADQITSEYEVTEEIANGWWIDE
jgi:integrase